MNYEQVAQKLIARAQKQGAQQSEAFIEVGRQSSVAVRDGEIETLTESTDKGVGIRVICNNRLGFAFTSDFDSDSLNGFVDRAIQLAQAAASNKLNGLPTREDLGRRKKMEGLFDPEVANLSSEWKIKAALEMERAAKAVDPRITAFAGVGAGEYVAEVHLASSEGLKGGYSGTYVYLYASPVASENGQLQTGSWQDFKRFLGELESPESVGRRAAERTVRMLGARKVKTQRVPVIFDPHMAASFVSSVAAAANGDAVFKKSSVLAPLLGKHLASEGVTLVDDGVMARGISSAPFDGEGVPTRRTPILERGVLKNFLYDAYTARKAKTHSTGNASRGYRSLPAIGSHNLYLEKGNQSPEEIINGVSSGLYVTRMLGQGADVVTGDYSRGANGMWIENGELTYPVQEVTVAGNLVEMLKSLDAVGNDLEFRGSVCAPTVRFGELTVSGE